MPAPTMVGAATHFGALGRLSATQAAVPEAPAALCTHPTHLPLRALCAYRLTFVHVGPALPRPSLVPVPFTPQPRQLVVKVHTPTGYPLLVPKGWEYT